MDGCTAQMRSEGYGLGRGYSRGRLFIGCTAHRVARDQLPPRHWFSKKIARHGKLGQTCHGILGSRVNRRRSRAVTELDWRRLLTPSAA